MNIYDNITIDLKIYTIYLKHENAEQNKLKKYTTLEKTCKRHTSDLKPTNEA